MILKKILIKVHYYRESINEFKYICRFNCNISKYFSKESSKISKDSKDRLFIRLKNISLAKTSNTAKLFF